MKIICLFRNGGISDDVSRKLWALVSRGDQPRPTMRGHSSAEERGGVLPYALVRRGSTG